MNRIRITLAALGALAMLVSTSCTTGPSVPASATATAAGAASAASAVPPLEATYAALGRGGGKVFTIDPATSSVRIYVFRAGRAARLGHNHVLSAPRFTGFVHLPATGVADARFDLAFRLDELEFDHPEHRAGLGAAFASILSPEAIAGTREHMLGDSNMQAAQFPTVTIHSLQVSGESPRLAARIAVSMHGQTRDQWVPLVVAGLPERLRVSGSLVLRQTDFGIHPYSVAGGLLAVRDEIVVDFRLDAH